jgi:hypothetical protein
MLSKSKHKGAIDNKSFDLKRRPVESNSAFAVQQENYNTTPFDFNQIPLQTKLKINTPGDRYEQEADRIAHRIVSTNSFAGINESGNSTVQRKPVSEEISSIGGLTTQRKCFKCEEEEEKTIQRKAVNAQPGATTASFNTELNASRGSGNSMDASTHQFMSSRFGVDFSHVNIHKDAKAAKMSQSINAKAFTLGSDVYFNKGEYNPQSNEGKRLLAHELVHIIQQRNIIQRKPRPWDNIPFDYDMIADPLERMERMKTDYAVYFWKDALKRLETGELDDGDLKNDRLRDRLTGLKKVEVVSLISKIKTYQAQRDKDINDPEVTDPRKKKPISTVKIIEWLEVRKIISTPMPDNAKVKIGVLGDIENYVINLKDVTITVKPDTHGAAGNETGAKTNFEGQYAYSIVNGKIENFKLNNIAVNPTKLEVEIRTKYSDSPDVTSGYGKGTTEADIQNKTTTLRVHEGQHGTDYIDFLTSTPLPVSLQNGINGELTRKEFDKILAYIKKITEGSCEATDQSGFSQDEFLKTENGKASGIVSCRKH